MTRNEKISALIYDLLGDPSITWQELLRKVHKSCSDIKHVYALRSVKTDSLSMSVRYTDRELITYNFVRVSVEG